MVVRGPVLTERKLRSTALFQSPPGGIPGQICARGILGADLDVLSERRSRRDDAGEAVDGHRREAPSVKADVNRFGATSFSGGVEVTVQEPGPHVGQPPLIETRVYVVGVGGVQVGKMGEQGRLACDCAVGGLLHRGEDFEVGGQVFVGVRVHRVDTVVVARNQVFGAGAFGEPAQCVGLAGAPAGGAVAQDPNCVGEADGGVPTVGQFGVMGLRGGEAALVGDKTVADVQVGGVPGFVAFHRSQ